MILFVLFFMHDVYEYALIRPPHVVSKSSSKSVSS